MPGQHTKIRSDLGAEALFGGQTGKTCCRLQCKIEEENENSQATKTENHPRKRNRRRQDVALRSSKQLHGHHRVGLEPPVFTFEGLDSVSAAEIDLHALGHGYYADTEVVLYDIAQLLHGDTPPSERIRLEPGPTGRELYWIFKK